VTEEEVMPISKDDLKPKPRSKPEIEAPKKAVVEPDRSEEKPDYGKHAAPVPVAPGVTEAMKKELDDLGVDPRLDNRVGDQRPPEVTWPAKPQQINPGDEAPEEFGKPTGKSLGSESKGVHGLGEKE
jgi:hypothetical protein